MRHMRAHRRTIRSGNSRVNYMQNFLGYIAYEGPSQIDGAPIVVIVNKIDGSENAKTGAIVQSFIIRSDVAPTDALKTGADESICGACVHRPLLAKDNGAAPCFNCSGPLIDQSMVPAPAPKRGQWRAYCKACDMFTFFDKETTE